MCSPATSLTPFDPLSRSACAFISLAFVLFCFVVVVFFFQFSFLACKRADEIYEV